ncbi:hypothetical protein HGA92_05635 [Candidatus Gracilibacteria bacterium]|nr:hypothetical protein [Candidatus Gracilibacteria bacterium]NUJ98649.1 hypothetical protein [Candidatus Gracilibacteria bacterium]
MGANITLCITPQIIDYNDYGGIAHRMLGGIIVKTKELTHNIIIYYDEQLLGGLYNIKTPLKGIDNITIKLFSGEILEIPEDYKRKIMEYLISIDSKDMECTQFYKFITGEKVDKYFSEKDWDFYTYNGGDDIEVGDIILIDGSEEVKKTTKKELINTPKIEDYKKIHFCIYIGKGLYLSKFGSREKFSITNMKNLDITYPHIKGGVFLTPLKYIIKKKS